MSDPAPSDARPTDHTKPPVPRVGEDGAPVYDQPYFLALARCGREIWNAWRATEGSAGVLVTFADIDFRSPDYSEIGLDGFHFGDWATFSGARFGNKADLSGAAFGERANLAKTMFGDHANLSGVTFGERPDLSGATFGDHAKLSGVTFGERVNLSGATFGNWADLSGTTFKDWANLADATFGDYADLSGTTFGRLTNLSGTTFGHWTSLQGWSLENRSSFRAELAGRLSGVWSEARRAAFLEEKPITIADPSVLQSTRFTGARFKGTVDFSGRQFVGFANFSMAEFGEPPIFDSLTNINSYGMKIRFRGRVPGWTMRGDVATRLRHLRKLADDSKNHDLERDLYIEERKAERGIYLLSLIRTAFYNLGHRWREIRSIPSATLLPLHVALQLVSTVTGLLTHLGWIALMFVYWLLADYGRSFVRPLLALALSMVLFHAAYCFTLRPSSAPDFRQRAAEAFHQAIAWPQANDSALVRAGRAFTLANAVPFVGALTLDKDTKERLVCDDRPTDIQAAADLGVAPCLPIPRLRFQALALLQSIVSTTCVFFAALALRNYFRVK